ncbi:low molecular weight phosphotyrosine protein phosphatase [Flavobacterium sp. I-SCBP12n]|uniref:protein-tyrosine-phosphatase n=1 Tax=Flavobacterium pygoscelis TaxID=2893176 RepID=A0A9X1XRQ9_9FLAO|nr:MULTISPECIES: low molecular weight protein-tyrosine-phosphatase [Flavobacterium]MCK8141854.1 low molecular weight phosphotyrosine protein phosphatase [Flavobacterium pygoscelis]
MPIKILMVCLGNICRSPLAQGILASKLPKDKFLVDSAGTGAWHVGHSPDERSITVAKKNQINISEQRGRQFSTSDFDTFDYIYVMDSNNYSDVLDLAKNQDQKDKVQMILNDLFPNENVDVPDPYFGLPNGFEIVYNMLDEVCDVISEKLIQKHQ